MLKNQSWMVLVFFLVGCTSLYSNSASSLVLEDFILKIGDDQILIGESFDDAITTASENFTFIRKDDLEWNLIGYIFDEIMLTHVDGFSDSVFSVVVFDENIHTFRGVGIGSTKAEVEKKYYNVLNTADVYSFSYPDKFVLQMTFFKRNRSKQESKKSYYGSDKKILSLTFHFDDKNFVAKMVFNVAGYE